ncbi:MFS transporter [Nocardioides gansuensis]|uniref:MFS transporter n=1 Tax=Nocardioides gansuensis TaxID=2138300 RepID=A0A2T8F5D8_9ACTN|nr:MFS transporter [Nocardioides gansuensis]PVG80927.1 MFS transporter [Nocardioides gansuensis]
MSTSSPWRCLRSAHFALWSGANLVSNVGTWMQLVAQSLLVLELTGSPALTGLTLSLQAAPGLLLGLVGGAAVDVWPRRLTVGVAQAILGGLALVTAALAAAGLLSVPVIMAIAVVSGTIAVVDGPAAALLGSELVTERDVPSAIALGSLATSAGRVLGTAAAAAAIALGGVPAAYAVNGLSFLVVAAVVPFLRPVRAVAQRPAGRSPLAGVRSGFGYLLGSRALLGLLVVGAVTSTLGRNYSLGFATLVTGPLHGGAGAYGTVSAVLAIGAVAGAVVAARLTSARYARVARLALVGALLQVAAAFAVGMPMLLLIALPLAIAESVQDTLTSTIMVTRPPEHLRGMVLGAWQSAASGWALVGPPTLGWLLESFGARTGLALGGLVIAAVIVAVRVLHISFPAIRRPGPRAPAVAV